MVAAREEFLGGHHFLPLAESIVELGLEYASGAGFVMETGAGIGYYIAHVLESLPLSLGLALDLSKYATRRAARAHARLDAVVTDIQERLPVKSGSVDLALNVFAPRPASELFRTLNHEGRLVVAFPAQHHLKELRRSIQMLDIDASKELRISRALDPFFRLLDARLCQWEMVLQHKELAALVLMGPSARHIKASALLRRIAGMTAPMRVTGAVRLHVYEPARHLNSLNWTEDFPEKAASMLEKTRAVGRTPLSSKGGQGLY
jgi:23S rRNA (guanine745-N1)-methyltransferase